MKIILPGNPLSTNHIYKKSRYSIYMTPEGKTMKESYQWAITSQWKKDLCYGKISLGIKLYFGDKRKRDIDNYNKLILDAMSGIVYFDDNQINKLVLEKFYDKKNPRIEIEIL